MQKALLIYKIINLIKKLKVNAMCLVQIIIVAFL